MAHLNSHCSWCGAPFPASAGWPRTCGSCRKTTWRNPLPVAVLLLPVRGDGGTLDGVLAIRRGNDPNRGAIALPGGFVSFGETWQEAAARETAEESGVTVDPASIRPLDVISAPDGTLLVFGEAPPVDARALPPFKPTDETTERLVIRDASLAFPLHEIVLRAWLSKARSV